MAKKWQYYVISVILFIVGVAWSITGIGAIVGIPLILLSFAGIAKARKGEITDEKLGPDPNESPWWLTWRGTLDKVRGNR